MAHTHPVIDSDLHFTIDPITREISNNSNKIKLMRYDHNSERLTFEIPRYVDGHDMSNCNKTEIHFINTGLDHICQGIYKVDDLKVSENDKQLVEFSWLISNNATEEVGSLSFAIHFVCTTEGTIEYMWSTASYSKISVVDGVYVENVIIEDQQDEDALLDLLCETSMISAVADGDGAMLTDENGKILLM